MKVPKGQTLADSAPSDLQRQLGAAVKAERRRLGVTQEELAWRADMHRTYLADIERGARNVTLRSIANLARALQVSLPTLLAPVTVPGAASATGTPGEILLVEDQAADSELTLRAFKQAKIANPVKVVREGRQALDYLFCAGKFARRQPVVPELVLLDLQLPDMSGIDVLREMKSHRATRHIPVIVLTGSRDDRSVIECGRLGAENYIVKPVEFDSFSRITPQLDLHWTLVRPRGGARVLPEK